MLSDIFSVITCIILIYVYISFSKSLKEIENMVSEELEAK